MSTTSVAYHKEKSKLLIDGYVKTQQIPTEIIQLLFTFYFIKLEWDPNYKHDKYEIKGNIITSTGDGASSAFLPNTISSGKHHWKFKILMKRKWSFHFGIFKVKKGLIKALTSYFFHQKNSAYAFEASNAMINKPKRIYYSNITSSTGEHYGTCCIQNDIVDMYVDFDTLELSFAVNETYLGKSHTIEACEYRAVISIYTINAIQLLLYDHTAPKDNHNINLV
eukprot:528481_1